MLLLRTILSVVAIATYFCVGTSTVAVASRLEITQVDVFTKHNWTAEDISVLGFYVDMPKVDAAENAHRRGLLLECMTFYCDVCEKQNFVLCNGIRLHLGSNERVEEIYVYKPLEEASPKLRRASVIQQFKGQTYIFFHRYSSYLRLKLFGRESGHEGDDPATRSTTYLYPRVGIKVYLSLSGNKRITEDEADLGVSFVHPTKP